jgi:hypothetical protein
MKKLITAIVATLLLITISPANSAGLKNKTLTLPTLAVLDTALDTSIPSIKEKLIGEVCILDLSQSQIRRGEKPSCPNSSLFMEGPGASVLPMTILSNRDFSHGTQMVSAAIRNNPNMNILFIRIIGHNPNGTRQSTTINTVPNALKWIYDNQAKYNIKAVSMSQGHHNLLNSTNYCPVTQTDYWVDWLVKSNIAVFFPAGNGRDYSRIDWPACIPSSIAVGGAEDFGSSGFYVSSTSNYDKNLIDFWAPISSRINFPGGSEGNGFGTSISTQIAAAKWLAISSYKTGLTQSQLLDLIKKTSTPITNPILKINGILLNSDKAITN